MELPAGEQNAVLPHRSIPDASLFYLCLSECHHSVIYPISQLVSHENLGEVKDKGGFTKTYPPILYLVTIILRGFA